MRPSSALALLLLTSIGSASLADSPRQFNDSLTKLVSKERWDACNHGRKVFRDDGTFILPEGVKRVWVDVGAYKLRMTGPAMEHNQDLAVIAIEPVWEHCSGWPNSPRVIGVPAAIALERGLLDFHLNKSDGTSSLLKTNQGEVAGDGPKLYEPEKVAGLPKDKVRVMEDALLDTMETVEKRVVAAVRLEDVIERIPADLTIGFLKTDIQGLDLQAIKSAGDHLQRVQRIQVEIINLALYEKAGKESMSSEREFNQYMQSMDFSLVGQNPTPNREWLDAFYVNNRGDKQTLLKRLGFGIPWPGRPPTQQ